MNFGELKQAVLERAGEIAPARTTPVFITDADAALAVNTALRMFAYFTLAIERQASIVLTPGVGWYHLASQAPMWLTSLFFVDTLTQTPIRVAALGEMDARSTAWQLDSGRKILRYTPVGFDLCAFYPLLEPAAAGYDPPINITGYYAACPALLVNDTDTPEFAIGDEFHPAIADGALPFARLKEGDGELSKTVPYFTRFIGAVREQARRVHARNAIYDRKPPSLDYFDVSRLWKAKKVLLPQVAMEVQNAGQSV